MPPLAAVRAANAAFSPSYLPVAVFVGGTSGIGSATAQAFARYTRGNAHIVIIGRNKAAADALIATFPTPTEPAAKHEFVACDASLIRNVHATTADLLARLPKVNFLVLTQGFASLRGRDETEEGMDRRLALHYYSRWKFIYDLVPLLRKAKDAGEDAKAMAVLGTGTAAAIDVDNLGLKKNYISSNPGQVGMTYTDLMMQSFAEQHPDIAFIQCAPGIVRTALIDNAHWSLRLLKPLIMGVLYPFSISQDVSGENMLYALLQSQAGVSRRNYTGEDVGKSPLYDAGDIRKRVWDHSKEEIEHALSLNT